MWQEFPSKTQYEIRAALAKCGLTTKQLESKIMVLSGGEAAKVRLCKILNTETNILILDEPTNHLDVDAKEELKKAIKEYNGSVLLVSNEPEFYRDVITDTWNCEDVTIIEAYVCVDHIHMLVEIPPKMSVSSFVGYLKGKSSLMIFEKFSNLKYKYGNRHFWCRGYYVDTVGKNKKAIQEYIKNQENEDKIADQISFKEYTDLLKGSK